MRAACLLPFRAPHALQGAPTAFAGSARRWGRAVAAARLGRIHRTLHTGRERPRARARTCTAPACFMPACITPACFTPACLTTGCITLSCNTAGREVTLGPDR